MHSAQRTGAWRSTRTTPRRWKPSLPRKRGSRNARRSPVSPRPIPCRRRRAPGAEVRARLPKRCRNTSGGASACRCLNRLTSRSRAWLPRVQDAPTFPPRRARPAHSAIQERRGGRVSPAFGRLAIKINRAFLFYPVSSSNIAIDSGGGSQATTMQSVVTPERFALLA